MTPKSHKMTYFALGLGLLLLILVGFQLPDRIQGYALLAGYALFAFNYVILFQIYAAVVRVSQTGETSSKFKSALALFSFLKFVGLIGALFLLIIVWHLPGLYIAMGSLLSLFVLTALLVTSYLKNFGTSTHSEEV